MRAGIVVGRIAETQSYERRKRMRSIEIRKVGITELTVDAVMNAANEGL